jgi:hypothetical protein
VALVRAEVSMELIASIFKGKRNSALHLLATTNVVPASLIPFALMIEAIRSSEKSVLTRATRRHIPQDGIIQWKMETMDSLEEWCLLGC